MMKANVDQMADCGCSTAAVEHTASEPNSLGCGFKSRRVLKFFLSLSISSLSLPIFIPQWSVHNQVPQKEVHL